MNIVEREAPTLDRTQRHVGERARPQCADLVLQAQHLGRARCCGADGLRERHAQVQELAQAGRQVEHRPVDAQLVDVRRDHIGAIARAHQRLGDLERERAGAMADVHDHARVPGAPGGLQDGAALVDLAHGLAGEAVGQDVARPHVGQHIRQRRRADADMHPRPAQRLDPAVAQRVAVDPYLDAQDHVAVQIDQLAAQVDVAVVEVGQLAGRSGQADRRDVQQRVDARLGRLDDILAEARPVIRARRADVQPGRHAAARGHRVGVDAPECRAVVDVGMHIDQPRRHILAAGVDHPERRLGRDVAVERGDAVALDRHIQPAASTAARVDHLAAFD